MDTGANNLEGLSGAVFTAASGPDIRLVDLTAYAHPAEEGGYWAEVPALPGCVTEADTLDALVVNLNEAIEGWLSVQTLESLTALGVHYETISQSRKDAAPGHLPRSESLRFAAWLECRRDLD